MGDHLTACSCTGLIQRRAKPFERAWGNVLREAGARIVPQQMLRDMDLALQGSAEDGRRVDVVAYNLPVFGGVPICADATIVSVLHRDGSAWRGAAESDGVRLRAARKRKEVVYPELVDGDRGRLVVLGCEAGGRWAPEALRLLSRLAREHSKQAPAVLRHSARAAWHRRWMCAVSVAAQTALAASLAEPAALLSSCPTGGDIDPGEVMTAWRGTPQPSRLPAR